MLISPLSCCHNLACSTEKRRGVTCARPTTNLRWCCSGRPAVSNPARYAPRLKCCLDSWPLPCRFLSPFAFKPICISYIYPPKGLSRSGLEIKIYHGEGINQAYLCLSTTGVHSFLVSESSSPNWMSIASPQAAPVSFPRRCRSVSARTTFRQGRRYSVSRSPRTRNVLYLTHGHRPDSTMNPAYYRQAGSVTRR